MDGPTEGVRTRSSRARARARDYREHLVRAESIARHERKKPRLPSIAKAVEAEVRL